METKRCSKCCYVWPIEDFTPRSDRPDQRHSHCSRCKTKSTRKYRQTEKGKQSDRDYYARRGAVVRRCGKYGIDEQQLADLLASTDRCDLCGREFKGKEPMIDHCHRTGHIRGLLCVPCNSLLGYVDDNPDTLLRAVEYIKNAGLVDSHRIIPDRKGCDNEQSGQG